MNSGLTFGATVRYFEEEVLSLDATDWSLGKGIRKMMKTEAIGQLGD